MKKTIALLAIAFLLSAFLLLSCTDTPPADDDDTTDASSTDAEAIESDTETIDSDTEAESDTEETDDTSDADISNTETTCNEIVETGPTPEETIEPAILPESINKNLVWLCTAVVTELDGVITNVTNYTYNEHGALTLIERKDPFYSDYRCELTYDEYTEYWSADGYAFTSRLCELTDIYVDWDEEYDWHFEDGKLVRSSWMNDVRYFTYYTYDDNGRLISEIEYHYLSDTDIRQKTEYKYDDNGNVTEKIYFNDDPFDVGELTEFSYTYNDAGQLIKEEELRYEENSTYVYEYSYYSDGTIESIVFYLDGELCSVTEYKYDEHGNIVFEKITWFDNNITTTVEFSYIYDENGNLISVNNLYDDDIDYEFIYDEYGNLIKQIRRDGYDPVITNYYYAPFILDDMQIETLRETEAIYAQYCSDLDFLVSTDYYTVTTSQYQ